MISFEPLWQTMKRKNISQYRLLKSGIDNKTLDGLKKNRNITLLTLEKLCLILDCTPNDIITFINESKPPVKRVACTPPVRRFPPAASKDAD